MRKLRVIVVLCALNLNEQKKNRKQLLNKCHLYRRGEAPRKLTDEVVSAEGFLEMYANQQ